MIADAKDCRPALNDIVRDHLELADYCLTNEHWKQLKDIRLMLKPFTKYTEFVSWV
jgi:hypothetical protein